MPAEPTFRGRVVALIGPQISSAGFLIARDLRASQAALLVGQQTARDLIRGSAICCRSRGAGFG